MRLPVFLSPSWSLSILVGVVGCTLAVGTLTARLRTGAADTMAVAAVAWLDTLDAEQRALATKSFGDDARVGWHFIPKNDRKGVQLRDMTEAQQKAARRLLRSALSELGYAKSTTIMQLEGILNVHEAGKGANVRDPLRYYFTVFGTPAETGSWGLSIEGHHLSYNFTVRDGQLVDTTPQFLGANPAVVKGSLEGLPKAGTQVLRDEEMLGFELINALAGDARGKALVSEEPLKEIRAAGEPQSPREPLVGISYAELPGTAKSLLERLVKVYCSTMPEEVAAERLSLIDATEGGWDGIHFAWAGALKPGIGHSYRIEGATFVIEFVNVQPDAEGNVANHIHCVWRDKTGDFDLPAAG